VVQSGLDRSWLLSPLLGQAAVGCAVLGCSGGTAKLVPIEVAAQRSAQVDEERPRAGAAAQSVIAASPNAEARAVPSPSLHAGSVHQVNVATLLARRSSNVLSESSIGSFRVPLSCGGATPCPEAQANVFGWVQLDEHTPRPLLPGRTLSSLLNEDEEMAPGEHTLLLAVSTLDRIYADAVSFRIEPARRGPVSSRSKSPPTQPGSVVPLREEDPFAASACFLLLPPPTVNGQGAAALQLLAVLLDVHGIDEAVSEQTEQPVVIHYTARAEAGTVEGSFPQGTSAVFDRTPRGDLHITATCERGGKKLATSQRRVILNPELTGVEQ